MVNQFGYACINMQLSYPKLFGLKANPISTNRIAMKKTFQTKGIDYVSELALENCKDLLTLIQWNKNNNFNFFRVTSNLFPWSSNYKLKELKNYYQIKEILKKVAFIIDENNMRITSHPGPFNVLSSMRDDVLENSINDLSIHGELFDLLKLSNTVYNKINIHIGASYGDKKRSLETFCSNYKKLPSNVKNRLTVENDDRESMYSVKDLYYGVYEKIGVPIVFDYHHHKFCDGGLSESNALKLAMSTWPQKIVPVVHYSESRSIEKKDCSIKPQSHSDYIYDEINNYGQRVDIMVEAKFKELAVIKYLKKYHE